MSYTPVELRHVRVGRRPFGYDRAAVEQVLSDVADSFETVWRDRGELADRVEALEQQLAEARQREQLLTNTLVAAEHAAEEMRERARREAELIVAEAHAEARSVLHASQGERERLLAEVRRIESLLRSALGIVGESHATVESRPAQPPVAGPSRDGGAARPASARSAAARADAESEPPAASPGPVAEEAPPRAGRHARLAAAAQGRAGRRRFRLGRLRNADRETLDVSSPAGPDAPQTRRRIRAFVPARCSAVRRDRTHGAGRSGAPRAAAEFRIEPLLDWRRDGVDSTPASRLARSVTRGDRRTAR